MDAVIVEEATEVDARAGRGLRPPGAPALEVGPAADRATSWTRSSPRPPPCCSWPLGDDQAAGASSARSPSPCSASPPALRAWIEDVVVDEAARGQGVGEALNRAALERAATAGARTVDLTSRPSREAANRLYQRLGFEPRETNVYRYDLDV